MAGTTAQPRDRTGFTPVSRSFEMPATRIGKWAMWLALAFAVGFGFNMVLVGAFGRSEAPDWLDAVLPFWGVALMASGVAAGVLALIAALRYRERSWAVMIAMVPGGFAIAFLLGEVLVPH